MIDRASVDPQSPVIDVGGGTSTLVDDLLDRGFIDISVVDLASPALDRSKARLGARAAGVHWVAGDITRIELPKAHFGLWHDRAVFHFLTDREARDRYVEQAWSALRPGGHIIVAVFGPDGPEQCSGLEVTRYDDTTLHGAFGSRFEKVSAAQERHQTPWVPSNSLRTATAGGAKGPRRDVARRPGVSAHAPSATRLDHELADRRLTPSPVGLEVL